MTPLPDLRGGPPDDATLVDLLDRVIDRGVVVSGDVVLSVADIDLVRIGLRLVLEGVDERMGGRDRAAPGDTGRPGSAEPRASADLGDELGRLISRAARGDVEPDEVQRGLASLVLTLVEVLRELMERQAIRRMDAGSVTDVEIERLGRTFLALHERMEALKEAFGLTDEDLNLDLGPLGRLRG